jgi:hypothetical protein
MTADKHPEARTFTVESRFQKLARRPGGVSREEAIGRAQASLDDGKPSFADWLDGEIQGLTALTRKASAGSFTDTKWVEAADAHSRQIRDVGTTMGYQLLSFVANNLCQIFEAIEGGYEYRADLVDCQVEALLLARQERYRNMRPDQVPELTAGLREVVQRAGQASDGPSGP